MAQRRGRHNGTEPLLIDRAAAAEIPPEAEIAAWARDKRVFISSVMSELQAERQVVADTVRGIGARPVLFEELGGRDADPENAYLGDLETCAIYVGLLGRRYGRPLPTRFSATHAEYRHAESWGLRVALWTTDSDEREGPQQSFFEEVRIFHVVPPFSSPDDLRRQIEDRLRSIAAEDLAPWVKLGNIIFRAREVAYQSEQVDVQARVQSDEVAHALEELSPGAYGTSDTLRFTWSGRSRNVRVKSVAVKTTAARSRMISLALETVGQDADSLMEMSFNGMTPDDLTEVAVRAALFKEKNPSSNQHMEFMTEMADPFESLRNAKVPDEIIRPLAELLLVDELVGSGRASRIHHFRLGASITDSRQLEFSWDPPKRYTGEKRSRREIRGRVSL